MAQRFEKDAERVREPVSGLLIETWDHGDDREQAGDVIEQLASQHYEAAGALRRIADRLDSAPKRNSA